MKKASPIPFIIFGIWGLLVIAGMVAVNWTFFILLGLSLGCLGSGVVLIIANRKY